MIRSSSRSTAGDVYCWVSEAVTGPPASRITAEQLIVRVPAAFLCAVAALAAASPPSGAAEPSRAAPIKIAVFGFELDDATPAAAYVGKSSDRADATRTALRKATLAAREELARSRRYSIVSVKGAHAKAVEDRTLRNCGGCEAAIARKLGAQESMLGIIKTVTQTDYYILVVIRNASTGKVVDSQEANFAGGQEGWANGAQVLIRYQVLPR